MKKTLLLMALIFCLAGATAFSQTPVDINAFNVIDNGTLTTGSSIVVEGTYAYTSSGSEVQIFNVADSSNIALEGSLPLAGGKLIVDGNYAYLSTANGAGIINVADKSNPVFVKEVNYKATASWPFTWIIDMELYDNTLILLVNHRGSNNKSYSSDLVIIDITTPESAVISGTVDVNTWRCRSYAMAQYNNYLYVSNQYGSAGENSHTTVFDLTDAANIVAVNTIEGYAPVSLSVNDAYLYTIVNSQVELLSLSNPLIPALVGTMPNASGSCYTGAWGYIFKSTTTVLDIYSFDGTQNPALLKQIDLGAEVTAITTGADKVYAIDGMNRINVIGETSSGSGTCNGIAQWDPAQEWYSYAAGDKRVNDGKVWECTNVAYAIYEPSGPYGHFGWQLLGDCGL